MTITSDIIRQHSGTIRVDSAPGRFTEMVVELPLTTGSSVSPVALTAMEAVDA